MITTPLCRGSTTRQVLGILEVRYGNLVRYSCEAFRFTRMQVGVLLATLEASGVSNDTLVIFHSDHGYSLGEHALWEKFTEFEHGTRVPLILRAPWRQDWPGGLRVPVLAGLVDLYPTIMELAGNKILLLR